MSGSVNKVILVGNLGADPEIRSFQNGGKVANLRIATSETWKDRNSGERKEKTEWHSVAVFSEGLVNVVERFLRKGSKIYIEGKLQTRKWQDQQGQDRYTTEIALQGFDAKLVMLDGASGGGQGGGGGGFGGGRSSGSGGGGGSDWGNTGGGDPYGNDFGGGSSSSSGGFGGGNRSGGAGGGGRSAPPAFDDDLNDDVPF